MRTEMLQAVVVGVQLSACKGCRRQQPQEVIGTQAFTQQGDELKQKDPKGTRNTVQSLLLSKASHWPGPFK